MSEEQTKPVAIVKPGSLRAVDKRRLAAAGYVVIESPDLECVRIVQGLVLPVGGDAVFHAAMHAMSTVKSHESVTDKFGAKLSSMLCDATNKPPPPPEGTAP